MIYTPTYRGLHLATFTPEQHERTCGYWYAISSHSTPHTAFRTRLALMRWLEDRGLAVLGHVPDAGTWGSNRVEGEYREQMHMSYDAFYALEGQQTRAMSNAQYTLAIITMDDDGLRTVHTLNPNCQDRPVFDYRASQALEDAGTPATERLRGCHMKMEA